MTTDDDFYETALSYSCSCGAQSGEPCNSPIKTAEARGKTDTLHVARQDKAIRKFNKERS